MASGPSNPNPVSATLPDARPAVTPTAPSIGIHARLSQDSSLARRTSRERALPRARTMGGAVPASSCSDVAAQGGPPSDASKRGALICVGEYSTAEARPSSSVGEDGGCAVADELP